jgi:GT2 family glycosyltransferase
MAMQKTRRRLRILRKGLAALVVIYKRTANPRRFAGAIWFVTTRKGLIGLRQWLLEAMPEKSVDIPPVAAPASIPVVATPTYEVWLARFDLQQEREVQAARRHLATLNLPDLLILAVVDAADIPACGRMVASWQSQIHAAWRAAIVASPDMSEDEISLLRTVSADDGRISVVTTPGGIAAAREGCDFTLLCFGSPLLNSLSAYMFLEAATRTGAAIVYSDHDVVREDGARTDPAFKPQFSPQYLAEFNYIGDCLLLSHAVPWSQADSALLPGLTLAAYDRLVARLVLTLPERHRRVEHVPFTLFHVQHDRTRVAAEPQDAAHTGPSVSLIIPTRDGLDYLRSCIDSILEKTLYERDQIEIIIVDNNSTMPETLDYLQACAARPGVSVLRYPAAFNFADINNVAAEAATGDILVFLNNDTVVHDPAWLSKLIAYARQAGVGIVGGKLLFPDGSIQHGGCVAGGNLGTVAHLLSHAQPDDVAQADRTREMSLMTGACIAVRRDVFHRVGGFDPVLRITWNDVKLCLDCLEAGLRNIYVADPLLVHDESKTRGPDNTLETHTRYLSEADYTRRRFRDYFQDDPSYNPNLSVDQSVRFAEPPRVRKPWFRSSGGRPRILLLSVVYKVGFGVAVVIQQHARKLVECGYDVVIGGPQGDNEMSFPECERVILGSTREAAVYAYTSGIALIVSHTPPFFEVPILIGGHIPVLAYDYGEPAAEFFQDPTRAYLINVAIQKRLAAAMTTAIATISQSVKNETLNKDARVIRLANSHLPAWSEAFRPMRDSVREIQGWQDRFVVLTVCRFHENERVYKGLDKISAMLREFPYLYPEPSKKLVWVLAGAGTPYDVEQVEKLGFTVFANVSDERLTDLYRAADAYMGFSKWEGYNLGIGQALAMGLPTLGSDIPAHQEFGIATTNSVLVACAWLEREVVRRSAATPEQRTPILDDWDRSATEFVKMVEEMLEHSANQKPRLGASHRSWQSAQEPGEAIRAALRPSFATSVSADIAR